MDNSKKNEKATESSKKQSSGPSETSDFSSDQSESRRTEKGRYKGSSSFMEGLTSSAYTEASQSSKIDKRRYKTSSSFTEGPTSSVYSDPSGSRKSAKGRNKNPSSSMQGATSSAYTDATGIESDEKEQNNNPKSFMKGETSVYAVNVPGASFQTTGTNFNTDPPSDSFSSDQSGGTTSTKASQQSRHKENIRLMPFKVKDVMEMIKDNPAYKDKSPVMIKVKENDIDQILEGKNVIRGRAEPLDKYLQPPPRESPVSLQTSLKNEEKSLRMSTGGESGRTKISKESTPRPEQPFVDGPAFAGADRTQKIFAMPDIQAFPVVQTAPSRRRRSRSRVARSPRRRVSRSRSRPQRSRPRRSRSRRSRSHRSRPRRVAPRPRVRRVMRPYPRYVSPCTTYPMCDDHCPVSRPYRRRINQGYPLPRVASGYNSLYHGENGHPPRVASDYNTPHYVKSTTRSVVSRAYNTPYTASSRGLYYPDDVSVVKTISRRVVPSVPRPRPQPRGNCCCNQCEEKLQFIQPGLCSKRKNVWTNEYAVIPKPQVHLIDPCEELDPSIYPRADNPCIRDGQGNPLTDCIGRPLRSPIGRRFLSFSANGSVMETSIRGNFWTGQPPLCVKCPMPSNSCGQDTTHNWWMSCGYPIVPNMNPFYQRVLATEMGPC